MSVRPTDIIGDSNIFPEHKILTSTWLTQTAKHVEKLIFMISFTAIRDIAKKLGKETGSVQIKVVGMLIGAEAATAIKKDAMKYSLEPGIVRPASN